MNEYDADPALSLWLLSLTVCSDGELLLSQVIVLVTPALSGHGPLCSLALFFIFFFLFDTYLDMVLDLRS